MKFETKKASPPVPPFPPFPVEPKPAAPLEPYIVPLFVILIIHPDGKFLTENAATPLIPPTVTPLLTNTFKIIALTPFHPRFFPKKYVLRSRFVWLVST
jgi:hypothetical protein